MPGRDQLEIINPGGEINFYDLESGGITHIGQHSDNQVVIDSPGVAPFQAVLDRREKPYHLTSLDRLESPPLVGPWLSWLITACLATLLMFIAQSMVVYFQTQPRPAISVETPPESVMGDLTVGEAELPAESSETGPTANSEMTYEEMFQEIAPQYGLDWRLMAELAYQESRMDPLAVGKSNDQGLMQIIPSTWNEWAPKVGVTDPFDPYSNALVAAAYLAYIRDYSRAQGYSGEHWLLVGYNWGPNNLRQLFESDGEFADVPETQRRYALAILQARGEGLARWQKSSR